MKNFINCEYLMEHINDEDLFLIDCRFDLFDLEYGEKAYKEEHIKNAFYLDINKDLSGKKEIHGGARPLPNLEELLIKLIEIGISMDSTIVVYDDKIYSSPRAFWQLKYLGYKKVYILNGGLSKWKNLNLPTAADFSLKKKIKVKEEESFNLNINEDIYANGQYVKKHLKSENYVIVDSRNEERFTGEYEPLYSKKGHIKGAINIPWHKNINDDGTLKDIEIIKNNFAFYKNNMEVIFYCGSAIEGAINYAVFDELAYNSKLYIGSMSDWITYDDYPVVMGNK